MDSRARIGPKNSANETVRKLSTHLIRSVRKDVNKVDGLRMSGETQTFMSDGEVVQIVPIVVDD